MSAFLKVLPALVLLFALESLVSPAKAQAKHKVKPPRECSLTSTNYDDCILTVRRGSFVALPPIQMAPGKTVTVEIDGARPSESYSLDQAPGSAAAINDVATSTFTDLQTVLGSATALLAAATAPLAPPPVSGGSASRVRSMKQLIEDCDKKDVNNQLSTQCILVEVAKRLRAMADAAEHARHVYQELTFLTSPDAAEQRN